VAMAMTVSLDVACGITSPYDPTALILSLHTPPLHRSTSSRPLKSMGASRWPNLQLELFMRFYLIREAIPFSQKNGTVLVFTIF